MSRSSSFRAALLAFVVALFAMGAAAADGEGESLSKAKKRKKKKKHSARRVSLGCCFDLSIRSPPPPSKKKKDSFPGCAALGLKIQAGPCSSAPTGLVHAFASAEKATSALSSSCEELSKLATPPPTAECCETLRAFGAAGCACDAVTLSLAEMALGVSGDGMRALVRGATAACRGVGVGVVDSCGGETC